jgi:hypothetical protein
MKTKTTIEPGKIPTNDEIREARRRSGLSARAAAAVVYRTIRWWQMCEAGEREMDPAIWELWTLKVRAMGNLAGFRQAEALEERVVALAK